MKINIELDTTEARAAIQRLIRLSTNLTPLMQDVGEQLLNSTRQRFRHEQAPDSTPWAPLSDTTKRRKTKNHDKILTEDGLLGSQIVYHATPNSLEIGSNRIYASTHQFGASKGQYGNTTKGSPIPWGNIPARPFLGLSPQDTTSIHETFNHHLQTRWANPT